MSEEQILSHAVWRAKLICKLKKMLAEEKIYCNDDHLFALVDSSLEFMRKTRFKEEKR